MSLRCVCDKCNRHPAPHTLMFIEQVSDAGNVVRHKIDLCDICRDDLKKLVNIDQTEEPPF